MVARKFARLDKAPVQARGTADARDRFAVALLARAPAEDVSAYEPGVLDMAAECARRAVVRHRKGESVVQIDAGSGLERAGRPMTVVTVVNDNMPFLFDSILGEITETAGEPTLVLHPVMLVKHGKNGVSEIFGDAVAARADQEADRVSVIQVHVGPLSEDTANGLRERLSRILSQVRSAVNDWKPMLARLDQAISEFRYAPVPLDKDAVS